VTESKKYINLPPNPSSFIESIRFFGYSMKTAVADIVDNSITAEAKHINIRFAWNEGNPWLAVIDDGYGMQDQELKVAMQLGGKSPKMERTRDDLGRFGIGLKTASLSQCRHLSVISKKNGYVAGYDYDLDSFNDMENGEWPVGLITDNDITDHQILCTLFSEHLEQTDSGTIVFWEDFDRIEERSTSITRERYFNQLMDNTRKHLELVFHRFLSPDPGKIKVMISMNGNMLEAFNPFNPNNLATQELLEQHLFIDHQKIRVQPYILPHHNKVSRSEYEKYAGDGGYLHNQGFYVYRNRRLLIKGSWFQLLKKDEMNKLIRIKVDIPNTLDHMWKIDVLKSTVTPPEVVKKDLRRILGSIESRGKKVFRQRGQKITSSVTVPIWNRIAAEGKIIYRINRDHPLLKQLTSLMPADKEKLFEDIVSSVEASFPRDLFFNDVAGTPEQLQDIEFTREQIDTLLTLFIPSITPDCDVNSDIIDNLLSTDPFALCKELTLTVLKERGLVHE